MIFLLILGVSTLVAAGVGRRSTWRTHVRRGFAASLVVAGVSHLVQPDPFVAHLPGWVPAAALIVGLTGVIEIIFGAALFGPSRHRRSIGRLLVAYLVAVFPANVYVAVADVAVDGQPGGLYAWLRLPIQALLVAIVVWSTRDTSTEPAAPTYPNRSTNSHLVTARGAR